VKEMKFIRAPNKKDLKTQNWLASTIVWVFRSKNNTYTVLLYQSISEK